MEILITRKERLEKLNYRLEAYKRILDFLCNEISKDKPERRTLLQTAFQNVFKLHQTRTQEKRELNKAAKEVSDMISKAFNDAMAKKSTDKDVSPKDDSVIEKSEVASEETSPSNFPAKKISIETIKPAILYQSSMADTDIGDENIISKVLDVTTMKIPKQEEVALEETSTSNFPAKKISIETIKPAILYQSSMADTDIGDENIISKVLDVTTMKIPKQEEVASEETSPSNFPAKKISIETIKPAILYQSSMADTDIGDENIISKVLDVTTMKIPKQEEVASEETSPSNFPAKKISIETIKPAILYQSSMADTDIGDENIISKVLDVTTMKIPKQEEVASEETSPSNFPAKKISIETIKPAILYQSSMADTDIGDENIISKVLDVTTMKIPKQEEVASEETSPSNFPAKKISIETIKPAILYQSSMADTDIGDENIISKVLDVTTMKIPKQEEVALEETSPSNFPAKKISIETIKPAILYQSSMADTDIGDENIISKVLDVTTMKIPKQEEVALEETSPSNFPAKKISIETIKPAILYQSSMADTDIGDENIISKVLDVTTMKIPKQEEVASEETSPSNFPAKKISIETIKPAILYQSSMADTDIGDENIISKVLDVTTMKIPKQEEVASEETSPSNFPAKKISIETIKPAILYQSSMADTDIGDENIISKVLDVTTMKIPKQEEVASEEASDQASPSNRPAKKRIKLAIVNQSSTAETNVSDENILDVKPKPTKISKQELVTSEETPPFKHQITNTMNVAIIPAIHNQSSMADTNTSDEDIISKILDINPTKTSKHERVASEETSPSNFSVKNISIETIKPAMLYQSSMADTDLGDENIISKILDGTSMKIQKQEEVASEETSPSNRPAKKRIKLAILNQSSTAETNVTDENILDVKPKPTKISKQELITSEETPPFKHQIANTMNVAIIPAIHNQSSMADTNPSDEDIISKILDINPTQIPKHEWMNLRLGAYNSILHFIHNELGKNKPTKQEFLLTARNHMCVLKQKRNEEKTQLHNSSEASDDESKGKNVLPTDENVIERYKITSDEILPIANEASNQLSVGDVTITNENIMKMIRHIKRSEVSEQEWMNLKVQAYKRILEFIDKEKVKNRPGRQTHLKHAFTGTFLVYKKRIDEQLRFKETSEPLTKVVSEPLSKVDEETKSKNILTANRNATESTKITLDKTSLHNGESTEIMKQAVNNQALIAGMDIKKIEKHSKPYTYNKKRIKSSMQKYKWMNSKVQAYKRILDFIYSEIGKKRPRRETFLRNAFTRIFQIYNKKIQDQIQLKNAAAETVAAISAKSITEEIPTVVKNSNISAVNNKIASDETSLPSTTCNESSTEIVKQTIHYHTEVANTYANSEKNMPMIMTDENGIAEINNSNLPTTLEDVPKSSDAGNVCSNKQQDIDEKKSSITDKNCIDKTNNSNLLTTPEHMNLSDTTSSLFTTEDLERASEESSAITKKVYDEQSTLANTVKRTPATINLQNKDKDIEEKQLSLTDDNVIDKANNSTLKHKLSDVTPSQFITKDLKETIEESTSIIGNVCNSKQRTVVVPRTSATIHLQNTNKNIEEQNLPSTDKNIIDKTKNSNLPRSLEHKLSYTTPSWFNKEDLEKASEENTSKIGDVCNSKQPTIAEPMECTPDTTNLENTNKDIDGKDLSKTDENVIDKSNVSHLPITPKEILKLSDTIPSQFNIEDPEETNKGISITVKNVSKSIPTDIHLQEEINDVDEKNLSMTVENVTARINNSNPVTTPMDVLKPPDGTLLALKPRTENQPGTTNPIVAREEITENIRKTRNKKHQQSPKLKSKSSVIVSLAPLKPARQSMTNLEVQKSSNILTPLPPRKSDIGSHNPQKLNATTDEILQHVREAKKNTLPPTPKFKRESLQASKLAIRSRISVKNVEMVRTEDYEDSLSDDSAFEAIIPKLRSPFDPNQELLNIDVNSKNYVKIAEETSKQPIILEPKHLNQSPTSTTDFLKSNDNVISATNENVSTTIGHIEQSPFITSEQKLVGAVKVEKIEDEKVWSNRNTETVKKLCFLKTSKNGGTPASRVEQNASSAIDQTFVNDSTVEKKRDDHVLNNRTTETVKKLWFLKSAKTGSKPASGISQNVSTCIDEKLVNDSTVETIEDNPVSNNGSTETVKKLCFLKSTKNGSGPVSGIDKNVSAAINPTKELPFRKFEKEGRVVSETDTSNNDQVYKDFKAKTYRTLKESEHAKKRILSTPPKKESTFDDSRVKALISKLPSVPNLQFNSEDYEDTSGQGILKADKVITGKVCNSKQLTIENLEQLKQKPSSTTNAENNKDENLLTATNPTGELLFTIEEQKLADDHKYETSTHLEQESASKAEDSEESSGESLDFESFSITDKNIAGKFYNNKQPTQPQLNPTLAKDVQQKSNNIDENVSSAISYSEQKLEDKPTPEEPDDNQKPLDETSLHTPKSPIQSQHNSEDFEETNDQGIAKTDKNFSEEMLNKIQELQQKIEEYKAQKVKDGQTLCIGGNEITNKNLKKNMNTPNKKLSSTQLKQNAKNKGKAKSPKQSITEIQKQLEEQEIRCNKIKDAIRRLKSKENTTAKSSENVSLNDKKPPSGITNMKTTQEKGYNNIDKHPIEKPSNNKATETKASKGINIRSNKKLSKHPGASKKLVTPQLNSKLEAYRARAKGDFFIVIRKYKEAVEEYSRAIDFIPNSAVCFYKRAVAYNYLDYHEKCIADLNKAMELNPKYEKIYGFLGMKYSQLGMFIEAKEAFAQALTFEPANKLFKTTCELIEQQLYEEELVKSRHTELSYSNLKYEKFIEDPKVVQIAHCLLQEPSLRNIASAALQNKHIERSNILGVLKQIQEETNLDNTILEYETPLSYQREIYPTKKQQNRCMSPKSNLIKNEIQDNKNEDQANTNFK